MFVSLWDQKSTTERRRKKGTISMWRPVYTRNEQGQLELEAAQTLDSEGCALEISSFAGNTKKD